MLEPINTALCAFGASGKYFHAPFLQAHPAFKLTGILERSKLLSRVEYPGLKIYRNIDELVSDVSIQLVVVNSINSTHFEFAKAALEHGKHVLVEKPLTATVKEAEILFDLAEKNGRSLNIFQNRRFDGDFLGFVDHISHHPPGKIFEAGFYFDRFMPYLNPKQHKELDGPGAGLLYDLGPHLIDQCLCLFGKPDAVQAELAKERESSEVVDQFSLWLRYPGFRAQISAGLLMREPRPAFRLRTEKYELVIPRTDKQEKRLMAGERPSRDGLAGSNKNERGFVYYADKETIIKKEISIAQGNYMLFFDKLEGSVNGRMEPLVSKTEVLAQLKIIEAAIISNREKKEIVV